MEELRPQQSGVSTLQLVRGTAAVGVRINAIGLPRLPGELACLDGCNQQDKAADMSSSRMLTSQRTAFLKARPSCVFHKGRNIWPKPVQRSLVSRMSMFPGVATFSTKQLLSSLFTTNSQHVD